MHGMCNYHIKISAMLITEKTINLYQPLHLHVNSKCHPKHSQIISQWMRSFLQHVGFFALVPYVVVDIMVATLVQNFLIKIVILIHCVHVYGNLYNFIVSFFYGSFLVMIFNNSENIV